jgi:hypothetical protein
MLKQQFSKMFLILIFGSALTSCTKTQADSIAKLKLSDLLVTSQDMPSGWTTKGSFSPASESDYMASTDSIEMQYYSDLVPDHAPFIQDIYRSNSGLFLVHQAKDDYKYLVTEFHSGTTPSNWKFKSQFSADSDFSCYTYSNVSYPVCDWVGRYDRIVIHVIAWLVPNRMTLSDLEGIISKIDTKAGKLILDK